MKVLQRIARGNGVDATRFTLAPMTVKGKQAAGRDGLASLLRPGLFSLTASLACCWLASGAAYYGLTLAAGSLGPDLYTGTALSGLVELPAILLEYAVIESYGRRPALAGFLLVAGLACLAVCLVPALTVHLALLGKFSIAAAFKVAYIISGEIFATSLRNSGVGLMSAVARCGAILAPFIVMAGEERPGMQFAVFGLLALVAGLLALRLPETRGRRLPDTVREMAEVSGHQRHPPTLHV